jgi:hypothetical protein
MPASDLQQLARAAVGGTCMLCGCTWERACRIGVAVAGVPSRPCSWTFGSGARLCTAHPVLELSAALAALEAVDAEVLGG